MPAYVLPATPKDGTRKPQIEHKCSICICKQLCFPIEMFADDAFILDQLVKTRIDIDKGQSLYKIGMPSDSLYIVRAGSLKTEYSHPERRSQVLGFHLPADWVGFDGINIDSYCLDAIALEPSKVCIIPMQHLRTLMTFHAYLQSEIHRIFSRKITQSKRHLITLGSMRAEERLAGFLVNISLRLSIRGCQPDNFHLPMSRADIASYLSIKQETLSRLLAQFSADRLIEIRHRHILLKNPDTLCEIAMPT